MLQQKISSPYSHAGAILKLALDLNREFNLNFNVHASFRHCGKIDRSLYLIPCSNIDSGQWVWAKALHIIFANEILKILKSLSKYMRLLKNSEREREKGRKPSNFNRVIC